jgi:hypothetical protein
VVSLSVSPWLVKIAEVTRMQEPRATPERSTVKMLKRHNNSPASAAFFPREAVGVTQGRTKSFTRDSALGKKVTFHFCPDCGSTLYWEPERMPHRIGVAVGAFADPAFPQPEQSVWTRDKHAWLELADEMHRYPVMPTPR